MSGASSRPSCSTRPPVSERRCRCPTPPWLTRRRPWPALSTPSSATSRSLKRLVALNKRVTSRRSSSSVQISATCYSRSPASGASSMFPPGKAAPMLLLFALGWSKLRIETGPPTERRKRSFRQRLCSSELSAGLVRGGFPVIGFLFTCLVS